MKFIIQLKNKAMQQFQQLDLFNYVWEPIIASCQTEQLSMKVTEKAIEVVKNGKDNHYEEFLQFALGFINRNSKFSSEDLRTEFENSNPMIEVKEFRVMGAVIKYLQRNNLIKFCEYGTYKRPAGHRKPVAFWEVI
jgi:hypothetical protein